MIKILVATDLSERSAHAVQRAVQLIRQQGGGEWCLLHVIDDDAPVEIVQRQVQQAETLLQSQAQRLAEQAVQARSEFACAEISAKMAAQ